MLNNRNRKHLYRTEILLLHKRLELLEAVEQLGLHELEARALHKRVAEFALP